MLGLDVLMAVGTAAPGVIALIGGVVRVGVMGNQIANIEQRLTKLSDVESAVTRVASWADQHEKRCDERQEGLRHSIDNLSAAIAGRRVARAGDR